MKKKSLSLRLLCVMLCLALVGCASAPAAPAVPAVEETQPAQPVAPVPVVDPVDDNFRTFYQIFVGSFSDSNRDGIGDLRGIINRLDYLNDGDVSDDDSLGVQGIWLSPIFSSPSYHKYDASDYYSVDWRFGTQEDLKELIDLCHQRNVKVILDLAINHTSSKHEWFQRFKEARIAGNTEDPYYNYYSCATTEERLNGVTYQKIANVDCWYECNFSTDMPELNFDNPTVRQEMLDVALYYMGLGVDGFRFDAVKYIYFGDAERSINFWIWYLDALRRENSELYVVGECWSGEEEILNYNRAMNCFNFTMPQAEGMVARAAKGSNISRFTSYVESYQSRLLEVSPNGMCMSFLSNHDMDRIAGAFAMENYMRMAANLYLLSPGSPTLYYGEEIGLRGSRGGENTDANRRLAMLWGDDDTIRNPVGSTYPENNQIKTTVADQLADPGSLYHYYCDLIALRHRYEAIPRGIYTALDCADKNLGGFLIEYDGQTLVLLHNTALEEMEYDLSKCKGITDSGALQLLEAIGIAGATLDGTVLTVGPQTSVILK